MSLTSWSVAVVLGVVAATAVAHLLMRGGGLPRSLALDVGILCLLMASVGRLALGRLGPVGERWFVVFGVTTVLAALYVRWRGGRILPFLDVLGVAIPLGQAIGRVGCHQAGCCHGIPWGAGRFPVSLAESLGCAVIFAVLLRRFAARRFEGEIALTYAIAYGVLRFGLEFLRGDATRGMLMESPMALSWHHLLAAALVAVGLVAWRLVPRRAPSASLSRAAS